MKLPPFQLEVVFEQYEHEQDMLVLGASDASNLTVQELFDLCGRTVNIPAILLKYGDVRGEFCLRDAVAKSYQTPNINAGQVLVTIGASEAIFIAMHVLVKAADHVLVCDPSYQPLASLARSIGANVELYCYSENGGFAPDLDSILARLQRSPKIKVLVVNTPHNPTGHAFSESSMKQLLEVAKEAGTTVLVDEVFHGIWHDAALSTSSAIALDSEAVVIGSLSKVYGLSGLRIGWLAGPSKIIDECRQMRHYTSIAPPLVVQELGAIAVENKEKFLDRTRTIVAQNYRHVKAWRNRHKDVFDWFEPQAGLVMLLKIKRKVNTAQFVDELARKEKVFLIPCSTTFNMPEGYLRLGLGTNNNLLVTGLERVSEFVTTEFQL